MYMWIRTEKSKESILANTMKRSGRKQKQMWARDNKEIKMPWKKLIENSWLLQVGQNKVMKKGKGPPNTIQVWLNI